jgi:glycosyltransferase involved in cell wall biosynthesis
MGSLPDLAGAAALYGDWLRTRASVVRPALLTVSLEPRGPSRGSVLLSYLTEAFTADRGSLPRAHHSNLWQCRQMARTFLELGFHVDVINFRNFLHKPRRSYDFLIDIRRNMERLAPVLGDGCTKIFHVETAHMLYQNAAEYRRLLDVQNRRGVTLEPRRVERRINRGIESADCAVLYGGEHSARTWAYAGKPMYQVPATPLRRFPAPVGKDFERARRSFVWKGSNGLVLKGLDLVLEAFADMPDHHLTVCGPIDREPDFADAYAQELFHTPNITTLGWVDLHSDRFTRVLDESVGLVYPSASESRSGTVITSMHAGLIPVITRECDVPIDQAFGRHIEGPTVKGVQEAVASVSELSASTLRDIALEAWSHARSTYTFEGFASGYRAIIQGLLGEGDMPVPRDCSAIEVVPAEDGPIEGTRR